MLEQAHDRLPGRAAAQEAAGGLAEPGGACPRPKAAGAGGAAAETAGGPSGALTRTAGARAGRANARAGCAGTLAQADRASTRDARCPGRTATEAAARAGQGRPSRRDRPGVRDDDGVEGVGRRTGQSRDEGRRSKGEGGATVQAIGHPERQGSRQADDEDRPAQLWQPLRGPVEEHEGPHRCRRQRGREGEARDQVLPLLPERHSADADEAADRRG